MGKLGGLQQFSTIFAENKPLRRPRHRLSAPGGTAADAGKTQNNV